MLQKSTTHRQCRGAVARLAIILDEDPLTPDDLRDARQTIAVLSTLLRTLDAEIGAIPLQREASPVKTP